MPGAGEVMLTTLGRRYGTIPRVCRSELTELLTAAAGGGAEVGRRRQSAAMASASGGAMMLARDAIGMTPGDPPSVGPPIIVASCRTTSFFKDIYSVSLDVYFCEIVVASSGLARAACIMSRVLYDQLALISF